MKTQNKWQRIGIILIAIMIGVGVPEYLNSQNVTDIDDLRVWAHGPLNGNIERTSKNEMAQVICFLWN